MVTTPETSELPVTRPRRAYPTRQGGSCHSRQRVSCHRFASQNSILLTSAGQGLRPGKSIRGVIADMNLLLSGDTSHLPYGTLRGVAELMGGLDERIDAMEAAIPPYTIH